ncbi:MAG: phosphotransferase family protein [Burkholderiales bacterium]|nr:MAG: phosphotransferase family protein [Burkholderiales bacterium]
MQQTAELDRARLGDFIRSQVEPFEGDVAVRHIEGGQSNPTYIVDAGARRYVLRRKPSGQLLPSAHAVEREFRVMHALAGSAVPVPSTCALCEDPGVLGTSFYLMDFVEGRILGDQTLPGMVPLERHAMYVEMNRVLACLHGVDYLERGLQDFGREGQYVERQVERWSRQYRASETHLIPEMDNLIGWLGDRIPRQLGTSIVHGDYRLDNVIFHATEPRIVAVLDWELATLGDPLVDFAYHCMTWHLALGTHRTLAGANLAALGIPGETEYVALYCQHTGREVDAVLEHWQFYLAFNMFRFAAIQQGVARRALDGNAANSKAREVGSRVAVTAAAGWAMACRATH